MKYMWVSRRVKKYVCLSKCGRQVQPMLTEVTDVRRTTPDNTIVGQNKGVVIDDYSGVIQGGSERINSAGI